MEDFGFDHSREAADHIGEQADKKGLAIPKVAVTLGSGLKSFADRYTHPDTRLVIPTSDIPHFAKAETAANGHDGNLIIAPIEEGSKETMAIWAGRIHFYQRLLQKMEGEWNRITDPEIKKAAITYYIAISKQLGIQDLFTSNAVGSSNPAHQVGDIVRVSDHMLDPDDDFGVPEEKAWFAEKEQNDPKYVYGNDDYFYGQGNLYSAEMYRLAQEVAKEQGWTLTEGVLNWRKGRGYETPAYTRARTQLGATLFGMSTAPEAVRARSIGFTNEGPGSHFASFSMVTNVAQSTAEQKLSHGEVSEAGKSNEDRFNPFMIELIRRRMAERKAGRA